MAKKAKKSVAEVAPVAAPEATTTPEVKADATLYVVGPKTAKPNTFFARVQAAVAQGPKTLAEIISGLQASHAGEDKAMVPKSKKDHDMVIRVRTNYAASHGFLQQKA